MPYQEPEPRLMSKSSDPFPTVRKLEKECDASWPSFAEAAAQTARAEDILRQVLTQTAQPRVLDPDSSLVLCGSFARHEMVNGSDCD